MKRLMKYYKEKKGITLVLIALMLAVLLFFLGMAVDISYMYNVKNQLQVAADAAALAGEGMGLSGTYTGDPAVLQQNKARCEAWKFAQKNNAAGSPVYLVTNSPSYPADCNDATTSNTGLNEANDAHGDIVVGNWDTTRPTGTSSCDDQRFLPTVLCSGTVVPLPSGASINAVKVVGRRTNEAAVTNIKMGDNPARVFIGQVFRLIGINWAFMSAKASAIAGPGPLLDIPALSLCIKSCNITGLPKLLAIQPSSGLPCPDNVIAWTIFKSDSSIPEKDIEDLIDRTRELTSNDITNLCGQCVTTNNGTSAINYLGDKFRSTTFDAANKDIVSGVVTAWRVGLVVFDYSCCSDFSNCSPPVCSNPKPKDNCTCGPNDCCQGCPPSSQGGPNEPYHIQRWARVTISKICDNTNNKDPICTDKGVVVSDLTCVDCADNPLSILSSGQIRLVK
jgi:hypothetical protein